MKLRQIILIGFGIVLLGGSIGLAVYMKSTRKPPERNKAFKQIKSVKTFRVRQKKVRASIPITGRLDATRKIDIYAEVGGVFKYSAKKFKEGVHFSKGQLLVKIDEEEANLDLKAKKSQLLNQITKMMPDIKIDYPDSYKVWKAYLDSFDINKPVKPFPAIKNQQIKYFLSSRNLFNQYYTIKSMEERLTKFSIYAPFSGVLTSSEINPGSLIRVGQKLGEFIDPTAFELEAAVSEENLNLINKGDSVMLKSSDINGSWQGEIIRIGEKINPGTQTANVFVAVKGKKLKEGMYLEGTVKASSGRKAIEIPRKNYIDEGYVWKVNQNSLLKKASVELVQKLEDKVIVEGLENNTRLLKNPFPGAFEGMKVKITEE